MSDEQRKDEEAEVEGHVRKHGNNMNEEPEVEAHVRKHGNNMNEEPSDEAGDDFEAHVRIST
jgi:hypothetical protein